MNKYLIGFFIFILILGFNIFFIIKKIECQGVYVQQIIGFPKCIIQKE